MGLATINWDKKGEENEVKKIRIKRCCIHVGVDACKECSKGVGSEFRE